MSTVANVFRGTLLRVKRIARLHNSTEMSKGLLLSLGISAMQGDAVLVHLVAAKTAGSLRSKRACLRERAWGLQALGD